ncbi:MAG: hypothetical protein ACQEW8_15570, partial [Actinomycetota bacterium]
MPVTVVVNVEVGSNCPMFFCVTAIAKDDSESVTSFNVTVNTPVASSYSYDSAGDVPPVATVSTSR